MSARSLRDRSSTALTPESGGDSPLPKQMSFDLRDRATGMQPAERLRELPERQRRERLHDAIGTVEELCEYAEAHGYEIDAILAASIEFRRHVGSAGFPYMVRGEAIHIARALEAVK